MARGKAAFDPTLLLLAATGALGLALRRRRGAPRG